MIHERANANVSKWSFFFFFFATPAQVILASSSQFLRDLLESSAEACQCEALTIHLPDFDSATVKNLLGVLYTGKEKEGIAIALISLDILIARAHMFRHIFASRSAKENFHMCAQPLLRPY